MTKKDYQNTFEYMNRYGTKVVSKIKKRLKDDGNIDTWALYNSINYKIKYSKGNFGVEFYIGDGKYRKGSGLPSEYGVYIDQGTYTKGKGEPKGIIPSYFFSAPIPGLTNKDFIRDISIAMEKDIAIYVTNQLQS